MNPAGWLLGFSVAAKQPGWVLGFGVAATKPPGWLLGFGAALAISALAWVAYFRWKDRRRPEPWLLMLLMVGGGITAALLSLAGYDGLERLGAGTTWEQLASSSWWTSISAALRIGGIEETAKLLPVVALALTHRHFDEPLDGIVYAACVGIGYATAESIALQLGGELNDLETAARAVAAPITHALFAAPMGFGLAVTLLRKKPSALLIGWLASVLLHALYDWLLARPQLPSAVSALVVLALWLWMVVNVPKLARLAKTDRA